MKERIYEDLSLIHMRTRLTYLVIGIIFVILVFVFWKIQILDHKKYWEASEANRIREVVLPAQRGLIRDRNGEVLATNIASFRASIIRENSDDLEDSFQRISSLLDLDVAVIRERVDKYQSFPDFYPIVIKDDLEQPEVAHIESRRLEYPELIVEAEPKRDYPHGTFAAHVLGYLQEISPDDIKKGTYPQRRMGELIGKTGMERKYEDLMVGEEGQVLQVVDSIGRRIEEISRLEPIKGQDIVLTLDAVIQAKAEELLADKEGCIVVMDPRSGEILAMASYPTFDPNKFINRFTPEEWMTLIASPEFPLENRAIRGIYSPGSVFKPLMALAALDLHLINESTTFFCSGSTVIYNHPFSCWFKAGHGFMNLYTGIKNSCNVYFYQVGKRVGIEEIAKYARMMGLGSLTQIDLQGEKEGLVPDTEWKRKTYNEPWYPGETISVSIGQGPLNVTPLQIAVMTAILGNRGKKVVPHLLLAEGEKTVLDSVSLSPALFEKVIRGMWLAANDGGTARAAQVSGFDVCGKTGSTQVVSRETAEKLGETRRETITHSWFSGFAPRTNPTVIITVLVEYGGMGGATAAPIAGQLFRLYKDRYDR